MDIVSVEILLKQQNKEGWLVIFSGFCLYFSFGLLFLWGDLMIYIYSDLRHYDSEASLMSLSWVFPLTYFICQITACLSEKLIRRSSIKKLSFLSFFLTIIALIICAELKNAFYFIMIYSIFIGISLGLLSSLPIVCGLRYFHDNKARVIGLIHLGGFFGCIFLMILNVFFINSDNTSPELISLIQVYFKDCVANHATKIFILIASCLTIFGVISLCYLRNPTNWEFKDYNLNSSMMLEGQIWKKAIAFIFLLFLLSLEGLFFIMFYKLIGLTRFYEDHILSVIGSFGVSLLWLMKIPWNFFKKTINAMICIIILQIIAKFFLYFINLYLMGILMEFVSLSGLFAISSRVFAENFDYKTAKTFNKFSMISFGIAAILICALKKMLITLDSSFFIGFLMKDLMLIMWILFQKSSENVQNYQFSPDILKSPIRHIEITEDLSAMPPS